MPPKPEENEGTPAPAITAEQRAQIAAEEIAANPTAYSRFVPPVVQQPSSGTDFDFESLSNPELMDRVVQAKINKGVQDGVQAALKDIVPQIVNGIAGSDAMMTIQAPRLADKVAQLTGKTLTPEVRAELEVVARERKLNPDLLTKPEDAVGLMRYAMGTALDKGSLRAPEPELPDATPAAFREKNISKSVQKEIQEFADAAGIDDLEKATQIFQERRKKNPIPVRE